jgi:hypothetical protein
MKKWRYIVPGLCVIGIFAGFVIFTFHSKVQVIGTISAEDQIEVERVARDTLRAEMMPQPTWKDAYHPMDVSEHYLTFRRQRLLRLETQTNGVVWAIFGTSEAEAVYDCRIVGLLKTDAWKSFTVSHWVHSVGRTPPSNSISSASNSPAPQRSMNEQPK